MRGPDLSSQCEWQCFASSTVRKGCYLTVDEAEHRHSHCEVTYHPASDDSPLLLFFGEFSTMMYETPLRDSSCKIRAMPAL
jgi:hypothetical protein